MRVTPVSEVNGKVEACLHNIREAEEKCKNNVKERKKNYIKLMVFVINISILMNFFLFLINIYYFLLPLCS